MINKEVHKIVKSEFNSFLCEKGYKKHRGNLWVNVGNEIVQSIYLHFSYGQEDFNFDIAVQPLCVPAEGINLCISQRLNFFDSRNEYHSWGKYDEQSLMEDIEDAKGVLNIDVFPWLKKVSDCESLISFLNTSVAGKSFHVSPNYKYELLTQLYYYKHHYIKANICLKKYILMLNETNYSIDDSLANLKKIKALAEDSEEKLDMYFSSIIKSNKLAWKI